MVDMMDASLALMRAAATVRMMVVPTAMTTADLKVDTMAASSVSMMVVPKAAQTDVMSAVETVATMAASTVASTVSTMVGW